MAQKSIKSFFNKPSEQSPSKISDSPEDVIKKTKRRRLTLDSDESDEDQKTKTPTKSTLPSVLVEKSPENIKTSSDTTRSYTFPVEATVLKITDTLANLLRSVGSLTPSDLTCCLYLCLNRLGPAYEGSELGVGDTVLLKALAASTGATLANLKNLLKKHGDLGLVAEQIRSRQMTMFKPKPLTVAGVFKKLCEIAAMSGNSAQSKKTDSISSLFVACRESEAKFLIRSLSGKLRIGLAEQTVLASLGQASAMTPFHSIASVLATTSSSDKSVDKLCSQLLDTTKGGGGVSTGNLSAGSKANIDEAVASVKQAYCLCPNYDRLVKGLLADGPSDLSLHCFISPGLPVKPMLAHPAHGMGEVLKRFDESDFTCEYKYDGERAQIHVLPSGKVEIYSRNQENNTVKYPDLVNTLIPNVLRQSSQLPNDLAKSYPDVAKIKVEGEGHVASCILDSEVVAWDREAGHILPFQILSTRKRKDVAEADVKIQVCVYAFDLLYINGQSLIEHSFRQRREILRSMFPRLPGQFMLATSLDSSDTDEIAQFLEESVKGNCEGLMVKTLDEKASYEIAKRSHNWLKLKKDYLDSVGDTLDLVVIGGFHGTGKRAGRYGGFLLACYDPGAEEYQTICKIGTGMKDDELESFSIFFKQHVIEDAKPYYQFTPGLKPDHWFDPVQVWEVKAADLSISPAHKAACGLADPEKGISLRFPRFVRIREDKQPEDATSAEQVFEMYQSQEQIKNHQPKTGGGGEDEDY